MDLALPGSLSRLELFATLAVGGAVAIFVSADAGAVIWAIGALVTFSEFRREARLAERFEAVEKLTEVYDLSASCDVDELRKLLASYIAIPEPELARLKNGVIGQARDELEKLGAEKSSGELPSGEYYSWLLPMMDAAPGGSTIRALSMMMDCEWDNSEPERLFIETNESAARRGVKIERVFVASAEVMLEAIERAPAVSPHIRGNGPEGLKGFFVDRRYLERSDATLLSRLGDGFIDLDGRVALIDLHSKDGRARGEVTMKAAKLTRLHDIHTQLHLHARELDDAVIAELRATKRTTIDRPSDET